MPNYIDPPKGKKNKSKQESMPDFSNIPWEEIMGPVQRMPPPPAQQMVPEMFPELMSNVRMPRTPDYMLADQRMAGAEDYLTPYNLSMTPQAIDVIAQPGQPFNEMVQKPQRYFDAMPAMSERDRLAEATAMYNRALAPYTNQYPEEDYYPRTTLRTGQPMMQSNPNYEISYVPQDELRGDLYPVRVPDELIFNKLMSIASAYGEENPNPKRFEPVKAKKKKSK